MCVCVCVFVVLCGITIGIGQLDFKPTFWWLTYVIYPVVRTYRNVLRTGEGPSAHVDCASISSPKATNSRAVGPFTMKTGQRPVCACVIAFFTSENIHETGKKKGHKLVTNRILKTFFCPFQTISRRFRRRRIKSRDIVQINLYNDWGVERKKINKKNQVISTLQLICC